MRRARFIRFTAWLAVLPALAFLVTVHPGTGGSDRIRTVATTYPTNAGKIFRWGSAQWNDEFIKPLSSMWAVNKPGAVRDQHGMLTLDASPRGGDVTATALGHNRRYGRWEARVRGRQYGTSGTPFHVVWELVPQYGGYGCGNRSIVLSDYALGSDTAATMHVRTAPNADFTTSKALDLRDNEFHTYAIEVTPDHVSWFVDTKVIMTERRPEALSGAVYAVRFRLVGTPGATMNQGRMQMDWVRYYTLARKNAQPITAPQATRTTYADAC